MDNNGFTLNPKVYDFLRWLAYVVLPAFATLLAGLGLVLNWGDATSVVGVVTLVDAFLGSLLNKSSKNYIAQNTLGDLVVTQTPDGTADGLKVVSAKEDPVFKDGGVVMLNVKREQKLN